MKKTSLVSAMLISAFLLLNLSIVNTQHAKAEGEVLISVAPSVENVLPGESFTVNIVVDPKGIDNIAGIQTNFEFDPLLVQVDSVVLNTIITDINDDWPFSNPGSIDNSGGDVSYISVFPTGSFFEGLLFPSTNFNLLTINLTAKTSVSGTSYLRLPDPNHGTTTNDLIIGDDTLLPNEPLALPYIITDSEITITDATSPTITNITSLTDDGTYKTDDVIDVVITFDEVVIVDTTGGTPWLELETGGVDQLVSYSSGSGTDTLTFIYTVQDGDITSDLDYKDNNSLILNDGVIKDAAGNDAILTLANPGEANSLGDNKDIIIDAVSPVIDSYTLNNESESVTFNPDLAEEVEIIINAGEKVEWTSIKVENINDSGIYKFYYPGGKCDGKSQCSQSWDGLLSAGTLVDSEYKIKVKIEDAAENVFDDHLIPYTITVNRNLAPEMTEVIIVSDNSDDNSVAYTNSTLTAKVEATDPDEDKITYAYQWKKYNETEKIFEDIDGKTDNTLSSDNFVKGDEIKVEVTPNDGTVDGDSIIILSGLIISNSAPTQPTVSILPDPAYEDSDLICKVSNSTDADEDSISYKYQWYKDGEQQEGITSNTVDSSLTLVGEIWKCEAIATDGTDDSDTGEESVTILADLLSVSNISNRTLKLNWTVPEDADSYDIRYSENEMSDDNWDDATLITSPSIKKSKKAGMKQSVEVNNLDSGTTYYFAMKSSDEAGNESGLSNIAFVKTNSPSGGSSSGGGYIPKDKTPPGKAKGLSVKNNGSENGGAGISWENPSDSDFSKVVIIRKEKEYPKNINDGTKVYENNGNKFEDGDVKEGKVYYYSVYSYDKSGNYSEPMESMLITDKSLVRKNGGHKVYIVNNGKKQWITTSKVFNKNGCKWENIYGLAGEDIDSLEDGEDIKGSGVYKLIKSKNGNKVYAVKGNRRLWIPTAEAFDKNGYKWEDVAEVDDGEMSAYVDIKLIKEANSPRIYYVYSGISARRWMPTAEIFLSYSNKWEDIETVDKAELDGYSDIKLIRKIGDYKVYYLENGVKRHITSPSVFALNGFNWNNIVGVNEIEFNHYKIGEDLK